LPINNVDENNRARDRLLAQLRTRRLVGCIGAGVSVWAGYRTWQGVINRLAAEVDVRRRGEVNTALVIQNHAADLLLCARRLGNDLGELAFTDFIRAEFGPTGAPVHDVLLWIAALPLQHSLTLNFDLSYEEAHLRIRSTCETITSCDRRAMARFLRDMDNPDYPKHAVHLHGKYDDPIGQIALTETGYMRLYRNNDLFKNFVWSISATRRLLFLGFGFTDTDFTNILRDCARDVHENGLNHFALVGLRPEENDEQFRTLWNDRYLLDPVFYNVTRDPNGQENHQEFVGIVNAISGALRIPEQARRLAVVPGPPVPLDPEDERRAEEINRRLLDRIERGGEGV